jgi:hypothetical protein
MDLLIVGAAVGAALAYAGAKLWGMVKPGAKAQGCGSCGSAKTGCAACPLVKP